MSTDYTLHLLQDDILAQQRLHIHAGRSESSLGAHAVL